MKHEINTWIDTLLPSLLGFIIVFFVLVLIMLVIYIMSAYFKRKNTKPTDTELITPVMAPESRKVPAKGSLGEIKLYDTPEKTAAMAMAIVADKMQKPLNEIRFISIRRINEQGGKSL